MSIVKEPFPVDTPLQVIFDHVVEHLLTMNGQAKNEYNCLYRDPKDANKACAVGCIIPDSEYDPLIEDMGVFGLTQQLNMDKLWYIKEHMWILNDLQQVHDNNENWDNEEKKLNYKGIERLREIASNSQLEWNFEDKY